MTCILSELTGLLLNPCAPSIRTRLISLSGAKDGSRHVAGRTSASMLQAFTIATLVREKADTP